MKVTRVGSGHRVQKPGEVFFKENLLVKVLPIEFIELISLTKFPDGIILVICFYNLLFLFYLIERG
ncbi:MAG: hypothetical protein COV67_01570 [Nitrospinae bacterium CG11_big_fil_rev_8_21_14_0_20_56_8]|nr:MAG: hypothetical protein COV67_01570 [Nitrospinae bacterium CG11_big_fil_rev_8_21_14_0_20_56_8]